MANYSEKAEQRREFRRGLESAAAGEHNKVQVNDFMLIVLVIIAAIVSFTDLELSWGSIVKLTALMIFLYIITTLVYRNSYARGIARGKADKQYQDARVDYLDNRQRIYDHNVASLVPEFCQIYRKDELREYRVSLLLDIEMEYDEYATKYARMTTWEIMKLPMSLEAKQTIIKCNKAKSLKLRPGMILNEDGEYDRHKLIGKSGKQRERQDKREQVIKRAIYVLFGSMVTVSLILDFSFTTIVQWVIRFLPVLIALISGDDTGYCNVTVTETNFKYGQTKVIKLFFEYIPKITGKPLEMPIEEETEENTED